MLTNLPEDEATLFHPIVFFDQGTWFFETRRRLDGEALFRHCLREPPGESRAADEGAPNRPPEETRTYRTARHRGRMASAFLGLATQPGRMAEVAFDAGVMHFMAASPPPVKKSPAEKRLLIDPLEPFKPLQARWTVSLKPAEQRPQNPDRVLDCHLQCVDAAEGSWSLLAVVGPEQMESLRMAAGALPEQEPGLGEEECLLRQAFSDDRVRENSFLAATLARLPLLFARAGAGGIRFKSPVFNSQRGEIGPDCWLVAVVDTGL